jgi:TonB family protein
VAQDASICGTDSANLTGVMRKTLLLPSLLVVALAGCQSTQPAPRPPAPAPVQPPPATSPAPVESLTVLATTLNVRVEPSTSGAVVTKVSKGERVTVLKREGAWSRIQTTSGDIGWVSSEHIGTPSRSAGRARSRSGCLPDREFAFDRTPTPSFSQEGAHGLVVVEAGVDADGNVRSTRVVSNSTGNPEMAARAEKELKTARFIAPVRNCVARAFIYTYKRSF